MQCSVKARSQNSRTKRDTVCTDYHFRVASLRNIHYLTILTFCRRLAHAYQTTCEVAEVAVTDMSHIWLRMEPRVSNLTSPATIASDTYHNSLLK
jgi:hypothetical protein